MKKKILSILLVLAMVLSMVPSALAADFVPQDINVQEKLHFEKLTLTNIEKQMDNSLKITITPKVLGENISYFIGETNTIKGEFGPEGDLGEFSPDSNLSPDEYYKMANNVSTTGYVIEIEVPETDYSSNGMGITLVVATNRTVDMKYYSFSLDSNGDFLVPAGAATAAITAPAHEGSVQGLAAITATITPDGTNAVTNVRYLIQNADGKYLTAAGTFGDVETWIEEAFAAAGDGGAQTWTSAAISAIFAAGAYTLKVQAKDTAGYGTAANATFLVDNTGPSISSISCKASAAELTNEADGLEFAVTYNEAVKGVDAADFTPSSGTVSAVTSNNGTPLQDANWTITVTGYSDGAVSLTEADTSATTDVAGNALEVNATKKTVSYTYDATAPAISTVTAAGTAIQGGAAIDVAASGTMVITLTEENKKISGTVAGITLSNSGVIANAIYAADGTITFNYSGLPANTSVTLTIPANTIEDGAGNKLATQQTYSFTTANLAANDLAATSDKSTSALTYGDTFTVTATGGNGETITFTPSTNLTETASTATTATYQVTDHTGTATVSVSQSANSTTAAATLTNVVNATLSPKAVTYTYNGEAITKSYDANTTVSPASKTALEAVAVTGKVGSDAVGIDASAAVYGDANVADDISITGLKLKGTGSAHYTLTAPTIVGSITKAELRADNFTWTDVSFAAMEYNGDKTIAADKVTGAPTALPGVTDTVVTYTRANANVGAAVAVGAKITAVTSTNYVLPVGGIELAGIGKNIEVTAKAVTYAYTGADITKVYDTTTAVSANGKTALEAVAVTGKLGSDVVGIDASAAVYASADVADGINITGLALKGAAKDNYSLTAPTVTGKITGLAETAPTITLSGATKNSFQATVSNGAKYYVSENATPSNTLSDYTESANGTAQTISGKAANTKYYVHAYTPAGDGNHLASAKASQFITTAEAGKVSVTFHGNGNNGGEMTAQKIAENGTANLTANAFTKTGFAFKGWATSQDNANAGTVTYENSASITVAEAAVDLYAVWTANTLTGVKPVAVAATKDVAYTLAAPTFTGVDAADATAVNPAVTYALTGGSAALTEYGLAFNNANGTITGTPTKVGTITGVTVTITGRNGVTTAAIAYDAIQILDLPALAVTEVNDSISIYAGDTLNISQFIKTVTGLQGADTIASLFTGAAAQDVAVSNVTVTFYESADSGVTWTKTSDLPTAAGTYWYTVDVAANGSFHAKYSLTATPTMADPTTGAKDGILTISNRPSGGGGTTTYKLTFETNGGSKVTAITRARNTVVELKETPTKEGFVFDGWFSDKALTKAVTEVKLTSSMTVYAKWTAEEEKKPEVKADLAFDKEMVTGYITGIVEQETGKLLFMPEDNMTRSEVAAVLARTLLTKMDATKTYDVSKFSDVHADAWYANYVGFLAELGVITGYSDGTFRPEQPIARSEFVAMVIRIDGVVTGENRFTDVDGGYWAEQYIAAAAQKGYIHGYGDGTFGPAKEINRAEVTKIMNAILGWTGQSTGENPFTDVAQSHWAYSEIVKAATGK